MGILKHGFMVACDEHHFNAVHYFFPAQSFVGLRKLRDIESAEQPNFSWISGRSIVLYSGHPSPCIVENGVGQGKSKEPLQAQCEYAIVHEQRLHDAVPEATQNGAKIHQLLSSVFAAEPAEVKLQAGNQPEVAIGTDRRTITGTLRVEESDQPDVVTKRAGVAARFRPSRKLQHTSPPTISDLPGGL